MKIFNKKTPFNLKYFSSYGRIAAVIFAGFSVYLVFSTIILIFLTRSADEVRIPDLVGRPVIEVFNRLTRQGLMPELNFRDVYDLDDGIILKQYPDAGEVVSENSNIHLVVSRNIFKIEMPDLVGAELPIAINKLKSLNYHGRPVVLSTGAITYIPSDSHANNTIIAQHPAAGERISLQKKINFLVSSGNISKDQIMPNVAKQSIDLCYNLLVAKGVIIKEEIIDTYNKENSGIVVSQKPDAGTVLTKGQRVYLKIYWYPMRDHPYISYEKVEYVIPADAKKGTYSVFIEDDRSKHMVFTQPMGPNETMQLIFRREGNAKITILRDKKPVRVMGINVDEY